MTNTNSRPAQPDGAAAHNPKNTSPQAPKPEAQKPSISLRNPQDHKNAQVQVAPQVPVASKLEPEPVANIDQLPTPAENNLEPQARPRYVRPKTPHRTMEPVDDLKHDDALADSLRDSDFVLRSKNPFAGRAYKRSRNDMPQLQRELHYGQYLTMPKGGKPIFSSRERKRKVKSAVAMVAIVAALAIAMLIILHLSGVIA